MADLKDTRHVLIEQSCVDEEARRLPLLQGTPADSADMNRMGKTQVLQVGGST